MKQLYLILIFFWWGCRSQSPVKSLYDDEYAIKGAYYKDKYNDLDRFIGEWKYSNGSTSLTITLQKKIEQHFIDEVYDFYEDVLVGEYMYIENGNIKVNTLRQLNLNLEANQYNIVGNIIAGPNSPYCLNCGPNDRKVLVGFTEPNREIPGYDPQMIFERIDNGATKRIKLKFRTIFGYITYDDAEPEFTEYSIPFGEYILTKVN